MNLKVKQNKIIILFVFLTLAFTGVETYAQFDGIQDKAPAVQAPSYANQSENMTSSSDKNSYNFAPIAKDKEEKSGFAKFLSAMLGVLVSAGAIFLGLKFYKNFILKKTFTPQDEVIKNSLQSPKDFKEAINLFLDKTDK